MASWCSFPSQKCYQALRNPSWQPHPDGALKYLLAQIHSSHPGGGGQFGHTSITGGFHASVTAALPSQGLQLAGDVVAVVVQLGQEVLQYMNPVLQIFVYIIWQYNGSTHAAQMEQY